MTPPIGADALSREPSSPGRRGPSVIHFSLLGVALVVAGVFAFVAVRFREASQVAVSAIRPSGLPARVPTSIATLMALTPVQTRKAPGFRFTDQKGRTYSLFSFRGRAVVLEFMDPHCIDICPIVSQEFVDAYHDLGGRASRVVFLAVNVNRYYSTVADMERFSLAHNLETIPSWHFFTGPFPALEAAWRGYGITVEAPNPKADIIHSSVVYFIDRSGNERYLANPMVDHTSKGVSYLPSRTVSSWGHGIALVARSLVG